MGLDNGLAPNRRQAIFLTNTDLIDWHIYTALWGDESTQTTFETFFKQEQHEFQQNFIFALCAHKLLQNGPGVQPVDDQHLARSNLISHSDLIHSWACFPSSNIMTLKKLTSSRQYHVHGTGYQWNT